ncbi:hypothetical protein ACFS4T_16980 [Pseudomonas lini]
MNTQSLVALALSLACLAGCESKYEVNEKKIASRKKLHEAAGRSEAGSLHQGLHGAHNALNGIRYCAYRP